MMVFRGLGVDYQGIIWEKGTHAGKIILYPANNMNEFFCIGTEKDEEPSILVSGEPFYFYVTGADNGNPQDYMVICDYTGPFRLAHSGDIFDFGSEVFRLL